MAEVVLFRAVTSLTINYLREVLPPLGYAKPVQHTVPATRPAGGFTIVRRTGGPRRDVFVADLALIAFEAWANDDPTAERDCMIVRAAVNAMQDQVIGGVQVYRVVEIGGPAPLPDPFSNQARYTFLTQIAFRGDPPS